MREDPERHGGNAIRVLVADDEAPARDKLRAHLAEEPTAVVIAEAPNGLVAVDVLRREPIDVVFLDVQMPGLTGFEVIDAVGADRMPPTVFVTAYDAFAVQAFEVEAIDYLLKPYDGPRFRHAFGRAVRALGDRAPDRTALAALLARVGPPPYLERLVVRDGGEVILVDVAEVVRLSAAENYVEIHTSGGAVHLARETLSRLEARLDPARFIRVHRSELLAVAAVRALRPASHGDAIAVLGTGAEVRVSRRHHDRLWALVGAKAR
jgi:two-component system LytT family response regulator